MRIQKLKFYCARMNEIKGQLLICSQCLSEFVVLCWGVRNLTYGVRFLTMS